MPKKGSPVTDIGPTLGHEQSIAATGISILKKGEGLGGKAVSLNKPKERPLP
jgi:hypothetical protein